MTIPQPASSPIRDSVGVALRFTRENWRFVLIVAAIAAVAHTVVTGLSTTSPVMGLFASVVDGGVKAFAYTALTVAVLAGVGAARAGALAQGVRVWAAMFVIGFFLAIVMFVISFPVAIALAAGPLASYAPELQAAGSDQAAVLRIMTSFAEANPITLLVMLLFYAAIWMYLTSRLYVAAPATADKGRILTFETWSWTKGAALSIIGARLMLLLPASILAGAFGYLAAYLVGLDPMAMDPTAVGPFLIYTLVSAFFTFALYVALEAGLSAALYRRLRPAEAPPSAP
jgi:MFS family permease